MRQNKKNKHSRPHRQSDASMYVKWGKGGDTDFEVLPDDLSEFSETSEEAGNESMWNSRKKYTGGEDGTYIGPGEQTADADSGTSCRTRGQTPDADSGTSCRTREQTPDADSGTSIGPGRRTAAESENMKQASRRRRTGSQNTSDSGNIPPRAVLAGCNTGMNADKYVRAIAELKGLAQACGLDPVATVTQNADAITHATYMGSGKVSFLKKEVEDHDADIVLFNEALTPMQMRNLEKILDTEVLDRTGLILQIFASRARTREARLQVESAQLQYMLPRLVGMRAELSRQGGGSGRLSNKGAGEQKLELDRRRIEHRIAELGRELEVVSRERATQRSRRMQTGMTRVALVGYTNAGKSTVMNALLKYCSGKQNPDSPKNSASRYVKDSSGMGSDSSRYAKNPFNPENGSDASGIERKQVFEADMLFATLDTSVRRINAPGNIPFLLSDTVGFVSDLPHSLVKAFRSTLDEVCCADLLLEVVDFSDPDYRKQIEVTAKTLADIGAGHIPVVYLYNKTDLAMESMTESIFYADSSRNIHRDDKNIFPEKKDAPAKSSETISGRDFSDDGNHKQSVRDNFPRFENRDASAGRDFSDGGNHKKSAGSDFSDGGNHKQSARSDFSDDGNHKQSARRDFSDNGNHKKSAGRDFSDGGNNKKSVGNDFSDGVDAEVRILQKSRPIPESIPYRRGDILYLAAGKGIGIPDILRLIDDALEDERITADFLIPYKSGSILQEIRSCGALLSEEYRPEGISVKARCRKNDAARISRMISGGR